MTLGRTKAKFALEILAICLFVSGMGLIAARLYAAFSAAIPGHPWMTAGLLGMALLGYLGADFVSGFVHFLGDTFFHADTPVIGAAFIYPFREHHVDQTAITRHDFVETNGNNSLASAAVLPAAYLLLPAHPLAAAFLFFFLLSLFGTNQFHKWAHQKQPGRFVRLLQRSGLILRPDHHQLHHVSPYRTDFCITAGWLNPILGRIGFFPFARRVLSRFLPED